MILRYENRQIYSKWKIFYSLVDDGIEICACPEKGGELSSMKYHHLFGDKELLFRGNDYSPTEQPFKGRAARFLNQWRHAATFSRIEPMKNLAKQYCRGYELENKSDYQKIFPLQNH